MIRKIEELKGIHIFDGSIDYIISDFSYPNIYAIIAEYDVEKDEFLPTKTTHTLTIEEVQKAYNADNGTRDRFTW